MACSSHRFAKSRQPVALAFVRNVGPAIPLGSALKAGGGRMVELPSITK